MSLKAFHIIFIVVSIVLCFGFGIWLLVADTQLSNTLAAVGGILSFSAGIGLILYAKRFLEKFKKISYL